MSKPFRTPPRPAAAVVLPPPLLVEFNVVLLVVVVPIDDSSIDPDLSFLLGEIVCDVDEVLLLGLKRFVSAVNCVDVGVKNVLEVTRLVSIQSIRPVGDKCV